MVWILFALLLIFFIIIILLLVRSYLINKEILHITSQLKERADKESGNMITVSFISSSMEQLAESINETIFYQEKLKNDVFIKDRKLKDSISNISHDLRTPLTSIIGYIFLIKNSKTVDPSEAFSVISSKAELLNELINELYDLSLIESDEYSPELEKVDIVSVVTDCLVGCFNQFQNKNITPHIMMPEKAIYIETNQTAIKRIVMNLLSNAIKYTSNDVRIQLDCSKDVSVLTISNNSPSLSQNDVSKLFDRFYTADKARTNGGTGLGLYIVKLLIEKVGGSINEVSLVNERLTISVTFPLWL